MLPNLLIIGAAKCGTTSLHEYLGAHPEIFMAERKELELFTRDDWRERIGWYEEQFPVPAPVRGESTPTYTMAPYLASTSARIHELVPDAKLIYMVRDPVKRTIANFVELAALGLEKRSIEDALTDVGDDANPHICPSRYASQLKPFREAFGPERILVIDQADLLNDRAATLRSTFEFLGVDPEFSSPDFERLHNVRAAKVRYNRLGYWMVRKGILTQRRGPFQRGPLIQPLRGLLSEPIETEISESARSAIVAHLRPEVERLREMTGKPFSGWRDFT